MKIFRKVIPLVLILLISFSNNAFARKSKVKYSGSDTARMKVGPIRMSGADTAGDEYVAISNGLVGSRYYIVVAHRNVGFGGLTGGFIMKVSSDTLRFIEAEKKGKIIIANDLYEKNSDKVPEINALIETNYYKNSNGTQVSTWQIGRERFGGGRISFKRILSASEGPGGKPVYLFKVKGYLRNVNINREDDKGEKFKKFKRVSVKGSFIVTLDYETL